MDWKIFPKVDFSEGGLELANVTPTPSEGTFELADVTPPPPPPTGLKKSSKNECSFLDYIQLLMISQAIQAMTVAQNVKKMAAKSSKNEMLIFGLHLTSNNQLSILSDESRPKCKKKMAVKSSNNEMLIFGLHSTSDDRLSDPSNKSHPKCWKMATK